MTRRASDVADRLRLTLDIGEEDRVASPLQPLLDQSPEDDLKAHRKLERDRRPPGKNPGPIQDVLGDDKENSGLILEHHSTSPDLLTSRPGFP